MIFLKYTLIATGSAFLCAALASFGFAIWGNRDEAGQANPTGGLFEVLAAVAFAVIGGVLVLVGVLI